MVTLKDIAAHVGVSASSVSLVLNDLDTGRVRPDIAAQIRQVASEMGYVPNLLAKGLKTRQSHTIGLVSDEVASVPFAGQMLAGAQLAASEADYLVILIDTAGHKELDVAAVQTLLQRNVEGLIVAAEFHREVELPLIPEATPMVVLNGYPANGEARADWVVPDETAGALAATRRLIQAGHRRIGLCNVASTQFVARDLRRAGYEAALQEAGIKVDPSLIVEAADPGVAAGRAAAVRLLGEAKPPTAVFCFSDQIAFGFYQVAQNLGLEIPGDLSVVGFDNQQFVADGLLPGLTTVQLPHHEMGTWAARQAIARIQGAGPSSGRTHMVMPCPLVERGSVGPPRR
ncbi:MAG: LacI family DNA-binding transcriptional regulator [Propionicimonas sp.]|jgi:LacI family transcriptional regulator